MSKVERSRVGALGSDRTAFSPYSVLWLCDLGQGVCNVSGPQVHHLCNGAFSSVQSLSRVQLFVIPWTTVCQASPVHHQLPELTQTHVHRVGDAIRPTHPLLSPYPPFNLSQHQVFSIESVLCIRWPKYWRFIFSISPSNEYSVLISHPCKW